MNRGILAGALAAASLSACQLDPGGRCTSQQDCGAGQICMQAVCVVPASTGDACAEDLDCAPWSVCESGACAMLENRCSEPLDCDPWEQCNADHSCELAPGRCQTTFDCPGHESWATCDLMAYRCVPGDGYCADDSKCQAGEHCDTTTSHKCVVNG